MDQLAVNEFEGATSMQIEVLDTRSTDADELIAGVRRYNASQVGASESTPLTVVARADDRTLVGGVSGRVVYGHFLIEAVWVDEARRGHRLGETLMEIAEQQARRRGCVAAQVDTMSFQAPGFYRKLGFRVVGVVDDFPEGHFRYFMLKRYA